MNNLLMCMVIGFIFISILEKLPCANDIWQVACWGFTRVTDMIREGEKVNTQFRVFQHWVGATGVKELCLD